MEQKEWDGRKVGGVGKRERKREKEVGSGLAGWRGGSVRGELVRRLLKRVQVVQSAQGVC